MFRIFLGKKLVAGKGEEDGSKEKAMRPSRNRNRRLFERYNVDHYHLTILNDQDILVVRDLSAKGFSSDVSERAFMRFCIGDVYSAKLRHIGEVFEIKVRVSWKATKVVGFEIMEASADFLRFLSRIIRPIKIASSMKEVNGEHAKVEEKNKVWLRGDLNTDLFIWKDENGAVQAWQLVMGDEFVEWSYSVGFATGLQRLPSREERAVGLNQTEVTVVKDNSVDKKRKKFAMDIIASLPDAYRDELLGTLEK